MSLLTTLGTLTRYKAWANAITFETVSALPKAEQFKQRPTRFGNIVHTLNHVFVIDEIFRAHFEGRSHGYTQRNTAEPPPLDELWRKVRALDRWYIDYAECLTEAIANEPVAFNFVDGQPANMTRAAMILHIINHGTYHRGFVGDMLYAVPAAFPANDLSVFLQIDASQSQH